jgi:hypothetical protein
LGVAETHEIANAQSPPAIPAIAKAVNRDRLMPRQQIHERRIVSGDHAAALGMSTHPVHDRVGIITLRLPCPAARVLVRLRDVPHVIEHVEPDEDEQEDTRR